MGHRGGNKELGAVPQFGAWDQKNNAGEYTSYSVVFTKAREKRKQKNEGSTSNSSDTEEESGPPQSNARDTSDRSEAFHPPRPHPHPHPRSHSNPPHPHYYQHPHPGHPPPHHSHHHQQSEPPAYYPADSHSPYSPPREDYKKKNKLLQYFGGCTRP